MILPEGRKVADQVSVSEGRAEVLVELHRYTADALTAGEGVPVFGSRRWCALPDGPMKTHAVVRAALALPGAQSVDTCVGLPRLRGCGLVRLPT